MKKVYEAVKYGIETLKISPDDFFKCIESSEGYDGDDYKRWLSSKIIDIASEDGVGFSQLLVKKFNIIQEISQSVETNLNEDFVNHFLNIINSDKIYVDGFKDDLPNSVSLKDVDFTKGIDLDIFNSFFVNEELAKVDEDLATSIKENKQVDFLFKLDQVPIPKKSELVLDAKEMGIQITTKDSAQVYRIARMVDRLELENINLYVLAPTRFLYSEENNKLWKYVLSFMHLDKEKSAVIKGIDITSNGFLGDIVFLHLTSTQPSKSSLGIALKRLCKDGEEFKKVGKELQYTESKVKGISYLNALSKKLDVYDYSLVIDKSLGISIQKSENVSVENSSVVVPIAKGRLLDYIVYYGVYVSLNSTYTSTPVVNRLNRFLTGKPGYLELAFNCIPIFLYNFTSDFVYDENEEIGKEFLDLLDRGAPYFIVESKDLFDLCNGFVEACKKDGNEGSFQYLRKVVESKELNSYYENMLLTLRENIISMSEGYY